MIKKGILALGIFGLFFSIYFPFPIKIAAQEETQTDVKSLNGTILVATESPKTKYILPYPGMLPDNPLYKIKVLRDRIYASLISDKQKKIDFYLLQADKGIAATAMLAEKNKISLAEEAALKAEHSMTIISRLIRDFSNKPNNDLFAKLDAASLKHQEVLSSLIKKLPENQLKTFIAVLGFSKSNQITIQKMKDKENFNWNNWENWQ